MHGLSLMFTHSAPHQSLCTGSVQACVQTINSTLTLNFTKSAGLIHNLLSTSLLFYLNKCIHKPKNTKHVTQGSKQGSKQAREKMSDAQKHPTKSKSKAKSKQAKQKTRREARATAKSTSLFILISMISCPNPHHWSS